MLLMEKGTRPLLYIDVCGRKDEFVYFLLFVFQYSSYFLFACIPNERSSNSKHNKKKEPLNFQWKRATLTISIHGNTRQEEKKMLGIFRSHMNTTEINLNNLFHWIVKLYNEKSTTKTTTTRRQSNRLISRKKIEINCGVSFSSSSHSFYLFPNAFVREFNWM